MDYEAYSYLWPPRPETAIPPGMLNVYGNQGYVAQIKKNGACNVIAVSPQKDLVTMNRHKEEHKLWQPTEKSSAAFKALPGSGWYVFTAELLHSKIPGIRDINYVFDILVDDGEYLIGETFMERQARLDKLFPNQIGETFSHRIINPNTWVAKVHHGSFSELFNSLTADEDEGVVLKKATATLKLCFKATSNSDWQVKCRRPKKAYSF